jgi:hypothetical protein
MGNTLGLRGRSRSSRDAHVISSAKELIMKTLIRVAAVALAVSPLIAFAQSEQQGLTRAQVRADLVNLEKAGYDPALRDPYYPNNLQAAEAKIQAGDTSKPGALSYGPSVEGTSGSGSAMPAANSQ